MDWQEKKLFRFNKFSNKNSKKYNSRIRTIIDVNADKNIMI